MKTVITGATGFLGKRLAYALRDKGHDVHALGRNRRIGEGLAKDGMTFVPLDLGDAAATRSALRGADVVYHCAALSSLWGTFDAFYDANVRGTAHVIDGCIARGVRRLVHVSTPSIYAARRDRLNVREADGAGTPPIGHYAATKLLAEAAVDAGVARGLDAITLRPQGLIGKGDPSVFPRFVRANARTGIPVFRNAPVFVDVTHVDNVVRALILAGDAPGELAGRKYNITNGEPQPLLQLLGTLFARLEIVMKTRRMPLRALFAGARILEAAARITGRGEPPLTRQGLTVVAYSRTLCIDAARRDLGYSPGPSVRDGIDEFAADRRREMEAS